MSFFKHLMLMRHGKAKAVDELTHTDELRELSDKGIDGVKSVARQALAERFVPQLIMSSSSKRTMQTTEAFVSELPEGLKPEIVYDRSLYQATALDLVQMAQITPFDVDTVMLVGHNPSMQQVVEDLAAMAYPGGKFRPGSLAVLRINSQSWETLVHPAPDLVFYTDPKLAANIEKTKAHTPE